MHDVLALPLALAAGAAAAAGAEGVTAEHGLEDVEGAAAAAAAHAALLQALLAVLVVDLLFSGSLSTSYAAVTSLNCHRRARGRGFGSADAFGTCFGVEYDSERRGGSDHDLAPARSNCRFLSPSPGRLPCRGGS